MEVTVALLAIFVASFILVVMQWIIRRYQAHQVLKRCGIPGPKPNFFDGSILKLKSEPHPNNIISSWIKQYGDVFGYYVGEMAFVVVKDLELLKRVLVKDFNLFCNRPGVVLQSPPFPQTLLGLKDKRWKEVRSILTPTFSSGKIKQMTDIISKKVDITVEIITRKSKNGEMFDIYAMVQGLTLDVIAACALAMKTNCQENPKDKLLLAVRDIFRYTLNKGMKLALLFPFLKKLVFLLQFTSKSGKGLNFIIDHLRSVVKERHQNPEFKSFDILQSLLDNIDTDNKNESGTKLSEEEVVANAFVVFLAGYETTATALAYIFDLLVKHPEVQNRVHQEIQEANDSSYETIQSLPYLDQVISESLRLHPPVTGFISRICNQDYQLGSYTLPKGAIVLAPVLDIHHDPNLWPNPQKFDPDRFSPSNKGLIKSMSYMPFGVGPRTCIGTRFALLEAKLILFKLLKKVQLVKCEKTEDHLNLTCDTVITVPKNGIWMKGIPKNED